MIVLALDCASAQCAVCVWQDGRVLSMNVEKMDRGQDARLLPLIQDAMEKAGLAFYDLDRMAAARGPGSFTGIRIGLATARGLGFASAKPVVGVDRFSLYRQQHKGLTSPLYVILESRREELYVCRFPSGNDCDMPMMLTPQDIRNRLVRDQAPVVVGDAAESLKGIASVMVASEEEVVTLAALGAMVSLNDPACLPRPYYLRAPDVTMARAQGAC